MSQPIIPGFFPATPVPNRTLESEPQPQNSDTDNTQITAPMSQTDILCMLAARSRLDERAHFIQTYNSDSPAYVEAGLTFSLNTIRTPTPNYEAVFHATYVEDLELAARHLRPEALASLFRRKGFARNVETLARNINAYTSSKVSVLLAEEIIQDSIAIPDSITNEDDEIRQLENEAHRLREEERDRKLLERIRRLEKGNPQILQVPACYPITQKPTSGPYSTPLPAPTPRMDKAFLAIAAQLLTAIPIYNLEDSVTAVKTFLKKSSAWLSYVGPHQSNEDIMAQFQSRLGERVLNDIDNTRNDPTASDNLSNVPAILNRIHRIKKIHDASTNARRQLTKLKQDESSTVDFLTNLSTINDQIDHYEGKQRAFIEAFVDGISPRYQSLLAIWTNKWRQDHEDILPSLDRIVDQAAIFEADHRLRIKKPEHRYGVATVSSLPPPSASQSTIEAWSNRPIPSTPLRNPENIGLREFLQAKSICLACRLPTCPSGRNRDIQCAKSWQRRGYIFSPLDLITEPPLDNFALEGGC